MFSELKQLKIGDQVIIQSQYTKETDVCTLVFMTKPRTPTKQVYTTWSAWGKDNHQEFTFEFAETNLLQRLFGNDKIILTTDTYGWTWKIVNINGEWVE